MTTKTQIHNLRREIITILQQNDEDQMGMDYIKELIGNEQQVIAEYKEEIRDMKTMLMEENVKNECFFV